MIRPLIEADIKMLALWDAETQRAPGNVNRDPETGRLAPSLYNVQDRDQAPPVAPAGNTEQAGLRRLRKAAEAGEGRP